MLHLTLSLPIISRYTRFLSELREAKRFDIFVAKFFRFCWYIILRSSHELLYCGVRLFLCAAQASLDVAFRFSDATFK